MNAGIYLWRNLITGQVLVGQTQDFARRKREHLSLANRGKHHNTYFQNAWNKYGANNFQFEVLERTSDLCSLTTIEQAWLDHFVALFIKVYNSEAPVNSPARGQKRTSKQKAAMSLARTNISAETRKNMSNAQKGKIIPKEVREKMSSSHIGKTKSKETKKRMSDCKKGKPFTEQHKAALRAAKARNK